MMYTVCVCGWVCVGVCVWVCVYIYVYIQCWELALWFFQRIASFFVSKRANHSFGSLKKREWEKSKGSDSLLGIKRGKTIKYIRVFQGNRSFFASDSIQWWAKHSHRFFFKSDKSDSLTWLFCKERWERFAHGCSFVKMIESESHPGRSLKWAILSERAKEQISNPVYV